MTGRQALTYFALICSRITSHGDNQVSVYIILTRYRTKLKLHFKERPSVSAMDTQQATPTTHHENLYFSDGDLVVASSLEENARTLFRVHTPIVARHSPVFKDMLSFPIGESSKTELYDGVPLVLLPDEMEEIAALLDVLYNPGSVGCSSIQDASHIRE